MAIPQRGKRQRRANRALDAANFALADVRDGPWPYLAVYLLTEQQWGEARDVYGAIFPVVVADLMRNTGRFNVGAALSTARAGIAVVNAGCSAAFLALGAIAAVGFRVFGLAGPARKAEARPSQQFQRRSVAAERPSR